MSELNPITRKEMFLAAAAGQNIDLPTPITRKEMFLAKIAEGAGTGGGTGGMGGADWNAAEGEPGHVLNRTHWEDADGTVHKIPEKFLPSTETEMPFIDLVALGMPAVGINDTQNIDVGGEQLKALMEKGPFKYKALFSLGEGMTIEVVATANPFCATAAGLYQATALCITYSTPILLNLNLRNDGGIQINTSVIGGEYPTWNGGSY